MKIKLFILTLLCITSATLTYTAESHSKSKSNETIDYVPKFFVEFPYKKFQLSETQFNSKLAILSNKCLEWKNHKLFEYVVKKFQELQTEIAITETTNKTFSDETLKLYQSYENAIRKYNSKSSEEAQALENLHRKKATFFELNDLIEQQQQKPDSAFAQMEQIEKVELKLKQRWLAQEQLFKKQAQKLTSICLALFEEHESIFEFFKNIENGINLSTKSDNGPMIEAQFKIAGNHCARCMDIISISAELNDLLLSFTELVLLEKDQIVNLKKYKEIFKKKVIHLNAYNTSLTNKKENALKAVGTSKCASCSKTSDLKKCGHCQDIFYCSKDCQLQHRPTHKSVCWKKDSSITFHICKEKDNWNVIDSKNKKYHVTPELINNDMFIIVHPESGRILQLLHDPCAQYSLSIFDHKAQLKYPVKIDNAMAEFIAHLRLIKKN